MSVEEFDHGDNLIIGDLKIEAFSGRKSFLEVVLWLRNRVARLQKHC